MLANVVATKRRPPIGSSEPIKPIVVKTIKVKLAPVHTATLAPAAAMIPIEESSATPAKPAKPAATESPKAVAVTDQPKPAGVEAGSVKAAAALPAAPIEFPPSAESPSTAAAAAAPIAVAAAVVRSEPAVPMRVAKVEPVATAPAPVATIEQSVPPTRGLHVHTGWIIQVGAFETETEAQEHLDAAQSTAKALLRADRFTETVTRGDKTLFRARFAGLEKDQAEATCRELKRRDIACMALKN
jgi:D-alanyl-D-alanine carboxypeptidase